MARRRTPAAKKTTAEGPPTSGPTVGKSKTPPSGVGLTVKRLTRSLKRRRHRAAILDSLAQQCITMFTSAYSDEPPWVIGGDGAGQERALEDVAFAISDELRGLAEKERAAIEKILNEDVAKLEPSAAPLPVDDDGDEEARERVLDKAIMSMPATSRK